MGRDEILCSKQQPLQNEAYPYLFWGKERQKLWPVLCL